MLNKKPLKDIASIQLGFSFRGAIEPTLAGNIKVVQAKDLKSDENIHGTNDLVKVSLELPKSDPFLRKNDVLLVSRGAGTHKVAVVDFNDEIVIASSSLYILRIKDQSILPEYLSLYLNSQEGQNELSLRTTGAYIQNLTRMQLETLPIPIPSIIQQRNLIALQKNIWQQEKLTQRKIELKKNILNTTISNISKGKLK